MKICYPQRYRVTTDTGAPVCEGSLDTVIECLNNIQGCNVPIQPNPVLSLDANNNAVITETGNCPDPNVVLYGYTITDTTTNTVLFNTTAAATVADITNTLANLQSDAGLVISGVNCPQTNSFADPKTSFLNNVSQGGNVIMSNIDLTDANQISALEQAIKGYLAANGGTIFDTVTITFDGTTVTINIVSGVAGFSLVVDGVPSNFTETASAVSIPCIGCYEITIYATPCDGSGNATIMGNSLFFTIIPLMHDGGDVYYFDGSPINVYSPFSNNLLGNGSTVQQIDDLLNNDPDKPAGVIFIGLTNSSDSSGSYEIAVGNACVNAPFIGVEPLPISLALVSQTGGQVLNGYVATNPYPTEYNFAYSSDGTNFTPQATWDAVSGNNISHDFGASVFGNGDYVRVCGRYVGGTAVWCEVIRIPTVAVSENINGNGDYVKTIFNQTPDTSRPDVFTDFIETLTISGHNDPAVNGSYVIEVNSTTVTATPALPAGLSIARINAHAIEVVATATFLADNTGSITIDETDIYGILKHSGDMDMQSVSAASETYTFTAVTAFDCFNFQPTNNMFDRWRINGGADILFPSGSVIQGSVMAEMQATLPQPNIVAIDSSPYTVKYIAVSTNAGTVSTIEVYNTTTSAWETFTPAYTNQGAPCV